MKQYLELLQELVNHGNQKGDRTGTGTLSKFGHQMRFNLQDGFPLVTTKKIHTKSVIYELLWFLRGDTNIQYLNDNGVHIWDKWADDNGDLGPIYGKQWRDCGNYEDGYIDQIKEVINHIRNDPNSRRLIVSSWSVPELWSMKLHPCHCLFQFYVLDGKLSCQLYQRSADVFLGLPFNIASYALLTHMVAQQCDLEVGEFIWTGGDVHLYLNHIEQAVTQLCREPRCLPQLILNKAPSIFDYRYEDIVIEGYNPLPAIKAEVAV